MRSSTGLTSVIHRHRSALLLAVLAALGGCGDGAATNPPEKTAEATVAANKPANPDAVVLPEARGTADPSISQTSLTDSPPVEIVPNILDFGFIPPNEDAEGSVKIFNRGTEPLMILAAEPSCKCTTLSDLGGPRFRPGKASISRPCSKALRTPAPRPLRSRCSSMATRWSKSST